MSDERSKPKLFGRYHDLIILLLGFVMTSLLGGYLAQSWQNRSAKIQRDSALLTIEQNAATEVFEELSRMMDKRLYRMRRVHNGLGSGFSQEKMSERWSTYREVLFEWNENLNRNLALVQRYFGNEHREILEFKIQAGFRHFGQLLSGDSYPDHVNSKYDYRQTVADELNVIIYDFDVALISKIQRGKVGSF